jgi:hypothetical protein
MMNKLPSDLRVLCGQLIAKKRMVRLEYKETRLTYSKLEASLIIYEIPWKKACKEP